MSNIKWYLKIFFIAFPILIALDISWVAVIANSFYKAEIGDLLASSPNYYAAIVFYVLYTIGLLFFSLIPALKQQSFVLAFIRAAALGFMCYSFYNVTNMAVLTHWSYLVAVIDTTWGVVVSAVTAGLTYLLASKLYGVQSPLDTSSSESVLV